MWSGFVWASCVRSSDQHVSSPRNTDRGLEGGRTEHSSDQRSSTSSACYSQSFTHSPLATLCGTPLDLNFIQQCAIFPSVPHNVIPKPDNTTSNNVLNPTSHISRTETINKAGIVAVESFFFIPQWV